MPPLGCSKKSHRACLVCGAATLAAHMGVDVCRACTIFYRRSAEQKKAYACRSSTNSCVAGTALNCRKCRLIIMENILQRAGANQTAQIARKTWKSARQSGQASTSSSSAACQNQQRARPLLTIVKAAYEKMCFARMSGELNARKEPPAPIRISLNDHPVYPATYASTNQANRLFLTCIVELGNSSFPEFASLPNEEKWSITVKFYFLFRTFDGCYRARKRFPDNMHRTFYSYTLWLSEDVAEHFFDDREEQTNVDTVKEMIIDMCRVNVAKLREIMDRVNPSEEEFLAVLVLMFWTMNGLSASDAIMQAGEKYRSQAFDELHLYFRDVLHLNEYSSRLGELHMFLHIFESSGKVKETYEVFRLLGAFPENCFSYQLSKD